MPDVAGSTIHDIVADGRNVTASTEAFAPQYNRLQDLWHMWRVHIDRHCGKQVDVKHQLANAGAVGNGIKPIG
jgi:hypothetical protein